MKSPIYTGLTKCIKKPKISFADPGHKGRVKMKLSSLAELDVAPDIQTDSLTYPRDFVADGEKLVADIFGSDKSYYLSSGTRAGIYAVLASVCKAGDKVIVDPECDREVIDAITVLALIPVFLKRKQCTKYSIAGGIDAEELEYLTERYHDAKMIIVATPTFYGVCTNIRLISRIAHDKKMLLFADESYGAHFNFSKALPETALECGADIALHSLSKTLGGLTGSGALHIQGDCISEESIREQLQIYQGGSMSFPSLCTSENAIGYAFKNGKKFTPLLGEIERGKYIINHTTEILWFDAQYTGQANIRITDPLKIVLNFSKVDMTAQEASRILQTRYGIEPHATDRDNLIFSASLYNTPTQLRRLVDACAIIGKGCTSKISIEEKEEKQIKRKAVKVLPYKAFGCEGERVHYKDSVGRLLRKCVVLCPHGVPIAVPGEKITNEHIELIESCVTSGTRLDGIDELHHIEVLSLSDSFGI